MLISFLQHNEMETPVVKVELALDIETQQKGLIARSPLPQGMLFVFPDSKLRKFHMRGVLHSLDMIFLNDEQEIVHITENALPDQDENIEPSAPAQYVLELPGGRAYELRLALGDRAFKVEEDD